MAPAAKKRADKYEDTLSITVSFEDVIKLSVNNGPKKDKKDSCYKKEKGLADRVQHIIKVL